MSPLVLRSVRLELVLETPGQVLARIAAMPAEERQHVSPDWLEKVGKSLAPDPWLHGFAIQRKDDSAPIGMGGFKGPPDGEGAVEIAYGIDPHCRGQGYATEAAGALVEWARQDSRVRIIRAHTLPAQNASTRVLEKCGFEFAGEVDDPQDGPVWRWELRRNS
jgi:RimJ/RimL family protein N-acetyltransferase